MFAHPAFSIKDAASPKNPFISSMKKKSTSRSAFLNLRVLIALVGVLASVFVALFARAKPHVSGGPAVAPPKVLGQQGSQWVWQNPFYGRPTEGRTEPASKRNNQSTSGCLLW
jgi:hypothetical protein